MSDEGCKKFLRLLNGKADFTDINPSEASARYDPYWEVLEALCRASRYREKIARKRAKREFSFRGIEDNQVLLTEIDTDDRQNDIDIETLRSADPAFFDALLPVCTQGSIGPVRAAMRTAVWLDEGRRPADSRSFPDEVFVFAGTKDRGSDRLAQFHTYRPSNGQTCADPLIYTLPGIVQTLKRAQFPKDHKGEYEIGLAVLQGDHKYYYENQYRALKYSAPPLAESPSVKYLDVVTSPHGTPHAEGKFRKIGARVGSHFYLAGQPIRERLEALGPAHPDRTVYETALKAVEDKNAALRAPIRPFD